MSLAKLTLTKRLYATGMAVQKNSYKKEPPIGRLLNLLERKNYCTIILCVLVFPSLITFTINIPLP